MENPIKIDDLGGKPTIFGNSPNDVDVDVTDVQDILTERELIGCQTVAQMKSRKKMSVSARCCGPRKKPVIFVGLL